MRAIVLVSTLLLAGLSVAQSEGPAPFLSGLGSHKFPVTTSNVTAQRYVNQGLILSYGFNNEEAHRSYMYATQVDPDCAMAYWGASIALGPYLNRGMSKTNGKKAAELVKEAVKRIDNTTAKERALILALKTRYNDDGTGNTKEYAEAMRKVAKQFPNDNNVQTLTAEALMIVHKWNYWNEDGTPKEWTTEITDMLAYALELNPENPGANHFTIHAWEGSKTPEQALPAADMLSGLVPGISHLEHMPSHIYLQTGDYNKGSRANLRATRAYDNYDKLCTDMGLKPIGGYKAHNWDFLWHCARWEGRGDLALEAANQMAGFVELSKRSQRDHARPIYTMIQFSRWDDIRSLEEPIEDYGYLRFVWTFGQAMAQIAADDFVTAEATIVVMEEMALTDDVRKSGVGQAKSMVEVAIGMTKGELFAAKGEIDAAIEAIQSARDVEKGLRFHETRTWPIPVQLTQGRILLQAGQLDAAEAAYRENLSESPENGWALAGLEEVLRAQGKTEEADACLARFRKAWGLSDASPTGR